MNFPGTPAPTPDYNLEDVYNEEVYPLVDEVYELCRKHGIPCILSFAIASKPEYAIVRTSYTGHEGMMPAAFGKVLAVLRANAASSEN